MQLRSETPDDFDAIRSIHQAAFETDGEAQLVDKLRADACPVISVVAERSGELLGHIMFSPATVVGHPDLMIAGLGPMAVLPRAQRQGIGSALVQAGLQEARRAGFVAVVLVGHVDFYPRFGFVPANQFRLQCEFDVPADAWMAQELVEDSLAGCAGILNYHPAFRDL